MHHSDDMRMGPVFLPNPDYMQDGNPSPMELGVGPLGRIYIFDAVPATSGVALLGAAQTTAGATAFALAAGAGVTAKYDPATTQTSYVLDYARRVTLTSAGNMSGVNFTIRGFDIYNQPMSQTIAGPNANTVATLKTFRRISSVTPNAAVGTAVSVGFNDTLGLPVRVVDAGYIADPKWAGVLPADAGTFVPADTTSPATPLTGDVRGVYTPSSAANGVRRLVMALCLTAIQVGPQATRIGAAGVDQV